MNVNKIMFPGPKKPDIERNALINKVPIEYIDNEYPSVVLRDTKNTLTVLYFHGNNETVHELYFNFKSMKNRFFNLVCPEYKGYGIRKGQETEIDCNKMAEKCLLYAFHLKKPVIIIGYSIGSGPATFLSARYNKLIRGLVLINPFISIKKVGLEKFGIPALFMKERFNNKKNIKDYCGNLMIICGKKDNIINFTHGVILHESCLSKNKKIIIDPDMGHSIIGFDYIFNVINKHWNLHQKSKQINAH